MANEVDRLSCEFRLTPFQQRALDRLLEACCAEVEDEAALTTDSPANMKVRIMARIRRLGGE